MEKVRLTRRAGRKTRYEQVVERHSQGLIAKQIACQLDMSERTVQTWLAAGTFPEAKKRRKKHSSFSHASPLFSSRYRFRLGLREGVTAQRVAPGSCREMQEPNTVHGFRPETGKFRTRVYKTEHLCYAS